MTGRELIIYIMENNLENEPMFTDGVFIGFISVDEAAKKLDVGVETIRALVKLGRLTGVTIGNELYILPDALFKCKRE